MALSDQIVGRPPAPSRGARASSPVTPPAGRPPTGSRTSCCAPPGPDVYDQWVTHEIPFNDPQVVAAFDDGRRRSSRTPTTSTAASATSSPSRPPPGRGGPADPRRQRAACTARRRFYQANWPEGTDGRGGRRRLRVLPAGGRRRRASRCWAAASSSPPSPTVPRCRRSRPTCPARSGPTPRRRPPRRRLGQRQQRARPDKLLSRRSTSSRSRSCQDPTGTSFRFDGSDLMPGAVGAGSFWKRDDRLDRRGQADQEVARRRSRRPGRRPDRLSRPGVAGRRQRLRVPRLRSARARPASPTRR